MEKSVLTVLTQTCYDSIFSFYYYLVSFFFSVKDKYGNEDEIVSDPSSSESEDDDAEVNFQMFYQTPILSRVGLEVYFKLQY